MKQGTKHSKQGKNNISEGMKRIWKERRLETQSTPKRKSGNIPKDVKKLILLDAIQRSTALSRTQLQSTLGYQYGTDRDMYDILGYKKNPEFIDYFARYQRQDIASRVVDAAPNATWRRGPIVYEENPGEPGTKFEKDWAYLQEKLKIFQYLERVDRLSGIGSYGILLLGLRDGGKLASPISLRSSFNLDSLIYLSVYNEGSAKIGGFVQNPGDPRFGRVEYYTVDLAGDLQLDDKEDKVDIHHSRVLHVAEGLLEDEIYGTPRLRPVYNLLHDLEKVVGGSPEMFWQGAYRGLHVDINPEFQTGDLDDADLDDLVEEIDEYVHGIRRVIRTQGVTVKPIDVELGDPASTFDMLTDLISGTSKIPKRILFGSERGELASEQDEVNWNSRIRERQEQFAEPQILRPFVDKVIELGIVSPPKKDYVIEWPNLFELDELRRAQAAWTWGRAAEKLVIAVQGGLLSKGEARTMLGADPETVPEDIDLGPQPDSSGNAVPFNDPEPAPIPEPLVMRKIEGFVHDLVDEIVDDKLADIQLEAKVDANS